MKKIFLLFCLFIFLGKCIPQDSSEVKFRSEEISIKAGKFFIKGNLLTPEEGDNFPVVVFCAGSGPTDRMQSIKYSRSLRQFIKSGFAFFIDDKPGSGESTGEFSDDSLFHERAMILAKEIEILKKHKSINPKQIGLYGSSQGGYVMSLALSMSNDIAFMVAWSCPGMNSIEQSAYLVKKQALCAGSSQEDAEMLYKYYIQRSAAKTYKEYLEAAEYLDKHPVIIDLGWGGVCSEKEFEPITNSSESFLNPADYIGKTNIPVLAIFGEKDTQIDPVQGAESYESGLKANGNKFYKVVTIPGVDHNMCITKTGSLKEQAENNKAGTTKLSRKFIETIGSWLGELKIYLGIK